MFHVLCAVDNIEFSIGSLLRGCLKTSDIATSESFCDSQAHLLLSGQNLLRDLLAKRGIAQPVTNSRQTDSHTGHVSILKTYPNVRYPDLEIHKNKKVKRNIPLALARTNS